MKRSKHSLSHYKLFSCDMGELVPIGLVEVLPGDTFQQATSLLVRVSPLLAPVMHPVHVRVHHWFVPHRIVWDDFESFITGGSDGFDASVFPTLSLAVPGSGDVGTLADYLGCPTGVDALEVSALPFRAYDLIFNEWYRDQDLVDPLVIDTTSGVDTTTELDLQQVAWEKDYFTSARPWTQKGPEITLPLSGDAQVVRDPSGGGAGITEWRTSTGGVVGTFVSDGASDVNFSAGPPAAGERFDYEDGLVADMSTVTAANINDLRVAFALQRYEEARARYGSRYTEYLRYLGVRSADGRLQRPEYLGGGRQTIQFSEVLQTAEGTSPVGELRGHGIGAIRSRRYRRFFQEHGYVVSLMSVRPKTMYVQGLHRTWNRRTKEDFWQKELQAVGQQEVLNKELYAPHTLPDGVFGYQDRYDEYRRMESGVSGEFRTSALNFWHMARIFGSEPALNEAFVSSVPTKRINAVSTNDVLWVMANHSIQARRMVAKTGRSFIF